MANVSHRYVYSVFLQYSMSIRAIDPVCPHALPMRVALFPSGMVYVTNISSISDNATLFCSELNGKHNGEIFLSLRLIVCDIC